jgi:hypothetical protein
MLQYTHIHSIHTTNKMNHNTIDSTKYTAHQHPGKFEGETAATEYFHEQMMEGNGETIFADCAETDNLDDIPVADIFHITAEEAEAFDLPIGSTFMIREDSQGFVYGSVHDSPEQAEAKFRSWLGL